MEQFREDLEPKKNASQQRGRKPGTYHWFEIQDNITYFAEFDQPKIVYADIAKLLRGSYDTSGAFRGNTLYIAPTNDLSLLAILHSRLFEWYARQEFQCLGDSSHGGRLRFIAQFMEKFPIASTTPKQKSPITQRVQTIHANPSSPDIPRLEAEIDELVFDRYDLTATERALVVAARTESCEDETTQENHDEPQTASTSRSAPDPVACKPRRRRKCACGLSPTGAEVHPEFDGARKRAGQSRTAGEAAASTGPLDAPRELATIAGLLGYNEVAERLAVNIAHCLDALLENPPEDIRITSEWICDIQRRITGDLFPEWAGHFRTTDVQVGTHLPPPGHENTVHIKNFSLDLEERQHHLHGAESIAEPLAWADWRFQWIHPYKDFNRRVGRILLIALTYKLALPPIDPASDEPGKVGYFGALRAADAGDLAELNDLWLNGLPQGGIPVFEGSI